MPASSTARPSGVAIAGQTAMIDPDNALATDATANAAITE